MPEPPEPVGAVPRHAAEVAARACGFRPKWSYHIFSKTSMSKAGLYGHQTRDLHLADAVIDVLSPVGWELVSEDSFGAVRVEVASFGRMTPTQEAPPSAHEELEIQILADRILGLARSRHPDLFPEFPRGP